MSQAVPAAFLPLSACTVAGHWSLVRTRAHHPSDVLAGGALGIAVAFAVGTLWPADNAGNGDPNGPERTTTLDGADARLLVHVESADGAPSEGA